MFARTWDSDIGSAYDWKPKRTGSGSGRGMTAKGGDMYMKLAETVHIERDMHR
jgi:hypothetical protein